MSLRSASSGFLIAIAAGVVASFLWAWVEPHVPTPHTITQSADVPKPVGSPSAENRRPFLDKAASAVVETEGVIQPMLPGMAIGTACAFSGLWLVVFFIQIFVQGAEVLSEMFEWIEDELHPIFYVMAFSIGFPIAVFWAVLKAEYFGTIIWWKIVTWPVRKLNAFFKGHPQVDATA